MGRHAIDLTGQRFGRLVAVRRVETPANMANGRAWWELKCDCGNLHSASAGNLKNGKVKSCGCLRKENKGRKAHGHACN